jgi:pyridinium-3,5-bisthiocarboxylic acid mononucleotide nickel chelatase
MKIAYLDCPTGLSGDMCLGALVHAGVPLEYLVEQLGRLGIAEEYHLRSALVHRNGQQATKVYVDLEQANLRQAQTDQHRQHDQHLSHQSVSNRNHAEHHHAEHHHAEHHSHTESHSHEHSPAEDLEHHAHVGYHNSPEHQHSRHLPEIEALILAADLPQQVIDWSLAVFRRLAEAEGAVHGISPDQVHFHEVGATDAIVDIVGTCLGLNYLGIECLYCSALPVGGGTIWAAHGHLPVPPPAVLKLWEIRQVPIYSNGIDQEMVTPTGAALVTVLAKQFGAPPPLLLQKLGLGAGSKELPIPNILRLWIGTASGSPQTAVVPALKSSNSTGNSSAATETITVLETQIDDLNPQAIGYVMNELLESGALDVFTQSIGMKKSRLGVLLTVICHPAQAKRCEDILFRETTTLGIRQTQQQRRILNRRFEKVQTAYGLVQIKVATQSSDQSVGEGATDKVINVQPEYEDCAQLARQHQIPWREVHRLALQAWYSKQAEVL